MDDKKITVTLDEVNNANVDAELHRQNVAERMAEHQEKIRVNFETSSPIKTQGGGFRNSMVYMAIFGLVFSIIAWAIGEQIQKAADNDPIYQVRTLIFFIVKKNRDITTEELKNVLRNVKEKNPNYKNNEYMPDKYVNMRAEEREKLTGNYNLLDKLYWVVLGVFIAIGLSIAEGCVTKNTSLVIKNGILSLLLGALGGFIVSLFINQIYNILGGGGGSDSITVKQVFARGVGWGILGAFVAIAPGIVMKSGKKFMLGIIGGAIGGIAGGILFDPISAIFGSVGFARFVNIVGLGVGAAVATVFLENIAKQGWLKVATGLIAGKQFILYRSPTVIGGSPKCEIYLFKDSQITAKHAAINNHNGEFIITSIEGAPIYVNNVLVKQQRLKTGDQVKIGNTIFIFEVKAIKNK
jgi:hypothetical protein